MLNPPAPSGAASLVPLPMKIKYSAGMYGCSAATSGTGLLLLYCYTDVFGIAPAAAGFIIFLGSAVDLAGSLGIPWLVGHVRSRLGRYRPFLIYGALPLGFFFAASFIRPNVSAAWFYPCVVALHLCYRAGYAAVLMPHASLLTRLSEDADERASVGAVKAIASNLAVLTVATVGMTGIERLGGHTAHAFTVFGLTFGAVIAASVLIAGMATRERIAGSSPGGDTRSVGKALRLIAGNRQIQISFAATLIFYIGYALLYGGIVYYFKYVIGDPGGAKYAALGIALGGIFFPPVWIRILRRTSKAFVWSAGCSVLALAFLTLYFVGPRPLPVLFLIYVIAGMGKCGVIINYFAVTADAVDYGEWRLGARAEAYSFGILFLMTKVGESIGSALLGFMLGWAGFVANQQQTLATVGRLRVATCVAAAVVMGVSALVMAFFRIDARRHRALTAELHAAPAR